MARPKTDIQPRLIEAAREAFDRDGVEGAALRQIAKAAGTSLGMIYYYFPTKDELFLAVVEDVYRQLLEELLELTHQAHDLRSLLLACGQRLHALSDKERIVLRLIAGEALRKSHRFAALLQRFKGGHISLLHSAFREAQSRGELSQEAPAPLLMVLAFMAIGPAQFGMEQFGHMQLVEAKPAEESWVPALLQALFEGLRPRSQPG